MRQGWWRRRQALAIALVVLAGSLLRVVHLFVLDISQPMRAGGLFLEFSQQIVAGSFRLPGTIPFYTESGIPFAYPPLPFYVQAILLRFFPHAEIAIANLLPPLVSIASLPLMWLLARELGITRGEHIGALAAFALLPPAYLEQIESAGLAEALGTLAILALLIGLVRAYRTDAVRDYAWAGAALSLCVLSSPGSAYGGVLLAVVFGFTKLSTAQGWKLFGQRSARLALCALVGAALSAPYWAVVNGRYGTRFFIEATSYQQAGLLETARPFLDFNVAQGSVSLLWNGLILLGLLLALQKRRWAIVIAFVLLFAVPREGVWLVAGPAALLAGIGVEATLDWAQNFGGSRGRLAVFGGLALYMATFSVLVAANFVARYPQGYWAGTIEAMHWVRTGLPQETALIVVSEDAVREWAPYVTRHTVLNVVQGTEWVPAKNQEITAGNQALEACEDIECAAGAVRANDSKDGLVLLVDRRHADAWGGEAALETVGFDLIWANAWMLIANVASE